MHRDLLAHLSQQKQRRAQNATAEALQHRQGSRSDLEKASRRTCLSGELGPHYYFYYCCCYNNNNYYYYYYYHHYYYYYHYHWTMLLLLLLPPPPLLLPLLLLLHRNT